MIIGTAGHIDHGKTALVKALTGADCDRLKEEKARGITLDLGYAYAEGGQLRFIDVPGHERLVHNMLAGATGIDFVLLVVAADDGPMPQTREHLAIAELLDLKRGAVVLTKVDAVTPERRAAARGEIAGLLAGSGLVDAPRFEVSAVTGEGIDALRASLLAQAAAQAPHDASGGFRLSIDRCFTLQGVGLVVTGTSLSGRVAIGDTVLITPPGDKARVRGIRAQDCAVQSGGPGERLALNLVGDIGKEDIARGMWVVAPALHCPIRRLNARVRVLANAEVPIRHWMPAHVHLGASDILGRIALLEGGRVASGESMLAEIVLEEPVGALWGDHFIVRDQSATHTLGGGRVLDIFPPARYKRAPERLEYLRRLTLEEPAPALVYALAQQPAGLNLGRFGLNRNLDADAAEALWRGLGIVVVEEAGGRIGFSSAGWQTLRQRLLEAARAEHKRAPDMIGIERDRLRLLTLPALSRAAFDKLTSQLLASNELAQSGIWLHLPEHRATLAATDADLWRTLKPLIEANPFNPPRVRDVATATGVAEETVRGVMKRVARIGAVYPVANDHFFTAAAVADLAGRVSRHCACYGAARAATLRDEIGGGRKVAIQILEFFDRVGYTRRLRDEHVLRGGDAQRHWVF